MGVLFSSQFKSSAGEEYKVDLFSEAYDKIKWNIIGGSGTKYYISGDWVDYLNLLDDVTLIDDAYVVNRAISSRSYNESENRTEIQMTVGSYDSRFTFMEYQETTPIFDPDIIDIATEWETDGDPILASIKASNTLVTYANNDSPFDWFFETYLGTTDKELKLIIYKDNASTWKLEWVGNVVPDLWEWDNMPKPRPFTIKAIDGLDMLKDIPYSDVTTTPDDEKLKEHLYRILFKNELYQFWDTLDPYLRESIEYKSNEVTGTLTDSHSPLDYVYMHDRMFYDKVENEKVDGISCYDALKAILELFSCRMFISQGCYYIQQVRNYDNATVIAYREFTKYMTTYTASSYSFKLTAEGGARTEDLVVMAGGKFAYLAGLRKASMPVRRHDQLQTFLGENPIYVNTTYASDEVSMGTVSGGVGSGSFLTISGTASIAFGLLAGEYLVASYLIYQGGTSGIYRPIHSGSSGSDIIISKEGFENWDMLARVSSSTSITFYNGAGAVVDSDTIASVSNSGSNAIKITLSSKTVSSNWVKAKTNDYTETYFLCGGNGNPIKWVTMDYQFIYFYRTLYGRDKDVGFTTPEIPFSAEIKFLIYSRYQGSASFSPKIWNLSWMFPVGDPLAYNEIVEVDNFKSSYTKDLELDPLLISELTTSTSLNHIRVAEDYLGANTPNLVFSETWDADFDTDTILNDTRVMEAMSLQYQPVERYLGKMEGQYYPHMCIDYNDKTYFMNACRKLYAMDETDGEWIEAINTRTGLTPTVYEGWEDSEDTTNGDGSGNSGLVGLFENNHKVSTVDSDADASGALTSLTIAANEVKLFAGETIVVVDPTNNEVTEELVLSADLAVGATTASIVSTSTTKDIVEGMFIQPKKDTIWNRVTTIQSDMNTDYMMEVAAGNIDGAFSVNVFGANQDVASGTEEDVNDVGGTYSYPTTADITHISQTIADGTMQNATIEIQGLDINWDLVTQSVDLSAGDTTDHIALTTALIRIFTMKVLDSVVASQDITAHNSGDTTTYATIIAGNNRTLMAQYTVPADHTAYMVSYYCDMVRSTNKDPKAVDFHMYAQDNANDYAWQIKHNKGIPQNGSGFQHFFKPYFKITEKTDIRLSAEPESTDAHVHAGFDIVVIENA